MFKAFIFIATLLSLSFADVKVFINNSDLDIKSLSKEEIKNLYLKKITHIQEKRIDVIDNREDYEEFYRDIVKKSPQQVHAYWMKEIFLGRKVPPKRVTKDEVKNELESNINSIGYTSDDLDLKVIYEND